MLIHTQLSEVALWAWGELYKYECVAVKLGFTCLSFDSLGKPLLLLSLQLPFDPTTLQLPLELAYLGPRPGHEAAPQRSQLEPLLNRAEIAHRNRKPSSCGDAGALSPLQTSKPRQRS